MFNFFKTTAPADSKSNLTPLERFIEEKIFRLPPR